MKGIEGVKIEFELSEVINNFDCVAGVLYQDNENDDVLLMPHFTMAQCFVVHCTVYDKATMQTTGDNYPFSTERLGEPVEYLQ